MKNKTEMKKIIKSFENIMKNMIDGDQLYPRFFDLREECKVYLKKFNDKNL